MAEYHEAPANATAPQKLLNWVDNRFPLSKLYNEHVGEYYAPKNFNFWYIFGSLAMLVLVIQIVTGIFLVMNYKPDAGMAFASVEYIMRDVPGGFLCPCHGSTFDMSGRVFKDKPAPDNLEVPPYMFLSDTRILIGESKTA